MGSACVCAAEPSYPRLSAARVAADPATAAAHLLRDGLLRVDRVLALPLAATLRAQCEARLAEVLRAVKAGSGRVTEHLADHLLHGPQLGKRHDCKLPLLGHVREALGVALAILSQVIGHVRCRTRDAAHEPPRCACGAFESSSSRDECGCGVGVVPWSLPVSLAPRPEAHSRLSRAVMSK